MATPSTSLTDRYVDVALRGTHAAERADLELELRGLIEDGIDAATVAGDTDRSDAEVATLTELGDPARLADSFRGRTAQLIGPTMYYQWRSLLRVLVSVIVPIVAAVTAFGAIVGDDGVGGVVGSTLQAAVVTAVQVTFWTTLVFAALERFGPRGAIEADDWTPADLPEPPGDQAGVAETAWSVAMSLFVIAAMFWQRGSTVLTDDGRPVPILDPEGWTFWWPTVIALLVAEIAIVLVAFRRHRWTPALFAAFASVEVGFAAVVVWLIISDQLLNPAFVDLLDWGDVGSPGSILNAAVAVSVVGTSIWDIVEKARATWAPGRLSRAVASDR